MSEWIQRFVIFHSGLLPSNGFDDTASLVEESQQILIYCDYRKKNCTGESNDQHTAGDKLYYHGQRLEKEDTLELLSMYYSNLKRYAVDDALKFVGYCRAVQNLPSVLRKMDRKSFYTPTDNQHDIDETEVHLQDCSLLFVNLEEECTKGLVAVIQVSRIMFSNDSSSSESPIYLGGGYASAIRSMIRKAHTVFQLLYGGGIHHRLSVPTLSPSPSTNANPTFSTLKDGYSFMEYLYQLLGEIRKIDRSFEHRFSDYNANDGSSFDHSGSRMLARRGCLHLKLNSLLKQLPMLSLRLDLMNYYDHFIRMKSSLHNCMYGNGRSFIDSVPDPIDLISVPITSFPSISPSAWLLEALESGVHHILADINKSTDSKYMSSKSPCFASAMFYNGRYQFTVHDFSTSPQVLLYENPLFETLSASHRSSFRMMQLSAMKNVFVSTESADTTFGSFLEPPASCLRACPMTLGNSVYVDGLGDVWIPIVSLPLSNTEKSRIEVVLALYQLGLFTFMFYFQKASDTKQGVDDEKQSSFDKIVQVQHNMVEVLPELSHSVMDHCMKHMKSFAVEEKTLPHRLYWGEPGVDVIYINWANNILVFLPSVTTTSYYRNDEYVSKIEAEDTLASKKASYTDSSFSGQSLLDCRHLFMKYCSTECVLALDDLHAAISLDYQQGRVDTVGISRFCCKTGSDRRFVEMGTRLRHGWIFGSSSGSTEVYLILHAKQYLKFIDALHAAEIIKKKIYDRFSS